MLMCRLEHPTGLLKKARRHQQLAVALTLMTDPVAADLRDPIVAGDDHIEQMDLTLGKFYIELDGLLLRPSRQ
jgi:hypothetical protein